MCSACENVDWNKFCLSKMLQTVECTTCNNIDVDLVWKCWWL